MDSYCFPPRTSTLPSTLPPVPRMDLDAEVDPAHPPLSPLSQFFAATRLDVNASWDDMPQDDDEFVAPPVPTQMRKNSLGLDLDEWTAARHIYPSPSSSVTSSAHTSPPLVPFTFRRRPSANPSSVQGGAVCCPPSPPLVALSMPPFSNPSSPSTSQQLPPPTRPERPVAHPLKESSKLRLEMTPLPAFALPLPDVEMSPPSVPWSTLADESPALTCSLPPPQGRKNSLVPLPIAPPTPPLTPSEELPPFDWDQPLEAPRGRSTKIVPLAKRRRVL